MKPTEQLQLFNVESYAPVQTDWSIDVSGEEFPVTQPQKSSHVQQKIVERANFQWVEEYPVKQGRYHYFRYCCLRPDEPIDEILKFHIPKGNVRTSIGQARADLVREAIASGKRSHEIIRMIYSWHN